MALKKKGEEKDLAPTFTQEEGTSTNVFETEEKKVEETPKTMTISTDMLDSMFEKFQQKMEKEYEAKLKDALSKVKVETPTLAGEEKLKASEIIEDWLEKPITFFSYSSDYALHGDVRMGREILPPGGKIKFKNLIRKQRRVGRDVQVICVSIANIQSKAQLEYLRQHSLYGITFHESMDAALSVDAMWAQKLIEANQQVSRMSEHDVITRCKLEGIAASQDLQFMRKQLTEKIAKQNKAMMDQYYASIENEVKRIGENNHTIQK